MRSAMSQARACGVHPVPVLYAELFEPANSSTSKTGNTRNNSHQGSATHGDTLAVASYLEDLGRDTLTAAVQGSRQGASKSFDGSSESDAVQRIERPSDSGDGMQLHSALALAALPRSESLTAEEQMARRVIARTQGRQGQGFNRAGLVSTASSTSGAEAGTEKVSARETGDNERLAGWRVRGAAHSRLTSEDRSSLQSSDHVHARRNPESSSASASETSLKQGMRRRTRQDEVLAHLFNSPVYRLERPFINQVAGTPAYIAPEVMLRKASFDSDLWSLGVLAFRCLAGRIPFAGESRGEVTQAIMRGDIRWERLPRNIKPDTLDFLRGLLQVVPTERIGSVESGGVSTLRAHPFLRGKVKWNAIFNSSAPLSRVGKHITRNPPVTFDSHDSAVTMVRYAQMSVPQPTAEEVAAFTHQSFLQMMDSMHRMRPAVIRRLAAAASRDGGRASKSSGDHGEEHQRDVTDVAAVSREGSDNVGVAEDALSFATGGPGKPMAGAGAAAGASGAGHQRKLRIHRGGTHGSSMPLSLSAAMQRSDAPKGETAAGGKAAAVGARSRGSSYAGIRNNEMQSFRQRGRVSQLRSRSVDEHAILASGSIEHRGGSMVQDEVEETLDEAAENRIRPKRLTRASRSQSAGNVPGIPRPRQSVARKLRSPEFEQHLEFVAGASQQEIGRLQRLVQQGESYREREARDGHRREQARLARSGFDLEALHEAGAVGTPGRSRGRRSGARGWGHSGASGSGGSGAGNLVADFEEGLSLQFPLSGEGVVVEVEDQGESGEVWEDSESESGFRGMARSSDGASEGV